MIHKIDTKFLGSTIRKNINYLIKSSGITKNELAKLSNVPYSTIVGILNGTSNNTRVENLFSISKVFNLCISNLTGELPLSFLDKVVPVIKWSNLDTVHGKVNTEANIITHISYSMKNNSKKIFALRANSAISSYYQDNTIIILENTQDYNNSDLLLVSLHNSKPTVKVVNIEGNEIYLQSLSDKSIIQKLQPENTIIFGVIRETRITQKSCYND